MMTWDQGRAARTDRCLRQRASGGHGWRPTGRDTIRGASDGRDYFHALIVGLMLSTRDAPSERDGTVG